MEIELTTQQVTTLKKMAKVIHDRCHIEITISNICHKFVFEADFLRPVLKNLCSGA